MPYFIFDVTPFNHAILPNQYRSGNVQQSDRNSAKPGESNVPVLHVEVVSKGDVPPPVQLTHLRFSGKGSGSNSRITSAKLYYSGSGYQSNSSFSLATAMLIDSIGGSALLSDTFHFQN